jgi:hypothetical protein
MITSRKTPHSPSYVQGAKEDRLCDAVPEGDVEEVFKTPKRWDHNPLGPEAKLLNQMSSGQLAELAVDDSNVMHRFPRVDMASMTDINCDCCGDTIASKDEPFFEVATENAYAHYSCVAKGAFRYVLRPLHQWEMVAHRIAIRDTTSTGGNVSVLQRYEKMRLNDQTHVRCHSPLSIAFDSR